MPWLCAQRGTFSDDREHLCLKILFISLGDGTTLLGFQCSSDTWGAENNSISLQRCLEKICMCIKLRWYLVRNRNKCNMLIVPVLVSVAMFGCFYISASWLPGSWPIHYSQSSFFAEKTAPLRVPVGAWLSRDDEIPGWLIPESSNCRENSSCPFSLSLLPAVRYSSLLTSPMPRTPYEFISLPSQACSWDIFINNCSIVRKWNVIFIIRARQN